MIVAPGQECAKLKESKASAEEYPMWGDVRKRATLWEQTTALSLLYAGADILIMYNPDAVDATKRSILSLMDGSSK
jgi:CO dehydrogenase/acetyl-CoA synthase delta subunit